MNVIVLQSVFTRDASLAFIFFIAFTLMAVLGVRFALYAYLNLDATELPAQTQLWQYLLLVGLAAALYGLLGIVEAVTAVTGGQVIATPYRDGVLLAVLLLLALTMREIHVNSALANAGEASARGPDRRRTVEMGFVLVVTVSVFGNGIFSNETLWIVVEGVGAVVLAGYGLVFGRRHLGQSSVRGTMVDSLLRHLLPVLTFAVLVLVVDLSILAGLDVAVVRHVQVVFVIMTATALMTSTIKLRQNVSAL